MSAETRFAGMQGAVAGMDKARGNDISLLLTASERPRRAVSGLPGKKFKKKPKKESKKVLTKAGERGIIYELPASGTRDEREMLKSASGVEQRAILENDTV